jgi:hypothetical protein
MLSCSCSLPGQVRLFLPGLDGGVEEEELDPERSKNGAAEDKGDPRCEQRQSL